MKISIGTNIKDGPWGGGNLFAKNLKLFLENRGIQVINHLNDDDIDLILITEPRKTSESSAFTHIDVKKYLKFVNTNTVVAHRLNECDERKGTNYVNKYLIEANKVATYSIYVSKWLMNLYLSQGITSKKNDVVYAGANENIFNRNNFNPWVRGEKLKIVTHHWGANWNKGFETYLLLDELISSKNWKDKLEFTYIGNIPKNLKFKNSHHIQPLSGEKLAEEIKKHHLYITGSLNEPSGNHHIEAAQCGLPIMYLNSGGTPEYCSGFGVEFKNQTFEEDLIKMIANYELTVENIKKYPFNSTKMCQDYLSIFKKMIENPEKKIISNENKILFQIKKKYFLILKRFKTKNY
jgi:hypothetical protein